MGWTFYHREKGESNLDHFRREFSLGDRLIDGATVGGTFYGALQTDKGVAALVILTRWSPRSEYNFGYKDMDEGMGPGESRAPARILDLLSPVEDLYGPEDGDGMARWARQWRERCRANIERAASQPKLKQGDTVKVSEPWQFGDGTREDTFTLINGKRNWWRRATDGRTVRLPQRSRWPAYEVLA